MDGRTASGRIAQLDVLRGLAILGILFMNIPYMAGYAEVDPIDPRWLGWTAADRFAWGATYMIEGTARGVLQLLFGAGVMIVVERAARGGRDRAANAEYLKRNLWLIAFGLFNVWVLMWAGDILLPYGIAALLLFPFRRLAPKWKLAIAVAIIAFTASRGIGEYHERQALIVSATAAEAKARTGAALTPAEREAVTEWRKERAEAALPPPAETRKVMRAEAEARRGSVASWWRLSTQSWVKFFVMKGWLGWIVLESFAVMLLGAALYQWGVVQGRRSPGFYLGLLAVCYGGFGAMRWAALQADLMFSAEPQVGNWILHYWTREPLSVGHVALISLLLRAAAGRALLRPFEAAGRLPLSIYFTAAILCFWIFGPVGLRQWGEHGVAGQTGIAIAIIAVQLAAANLWLRGFVTGPFEWAWKSLTYGRALPFRREGGSASGGAVVAAE